MESVQVAISNARPEDLDLDALSAGVSVLAQVVPRLDDVRVHIAGDFVAAVRETVNDPGYAAAYNAERLAGRAAGKAIGQPDGTTDLIIDASMLATVNEPDTDHIERVFHHEGLHIAAEQRGESVYNLRRRNGLDAGSNRGYFGAVSGVMVEDYRAERALCEAGRWPDEQYRANFAQAVRTFADAAWDGVNLRYPGESIQRTYDTVTSAFHQLATYTGYVAAEMLTAQERDVAVDPEIKQRLLGPAWDAVVASLDRIPPADTPIEREDLDALVWATADCVEAWMEHVGFTLTDQPDGSTYFDVLRHDFQAPFDD